MGNNAPNISAQKGSFIDLLAVRLLVAVDSNTPEVSGAVMADTGELAAG